MVRRPSAEYAHERWISLIRNLAHQRKSAARNTLLRPDRDISPWSARDIRAASASGLQLTDVHSAVDQRRIDTDQLRRANVGPDTVKISLCRCSRPHQTDDRSSRTVFTQKHSEPLYELEMAS